MSRLRLRLGLVGCLDVSVRAGPCASQVNGVCVGEGEEYVYIDNVAVDVGARRKGPRQRCSRRPATWPFAGVPVSSTPMSTSKTLPARRLYHALRLPRAEGRADRRGNGSRERRSVVVAQAGWVGPAPRASAAHAGGERKAAAAVGDCTCGAVFDECDECVCHPAKKD